MPGTQQIMFCFLELSGTFFQTFSIQGWLNPWMWDPQSLWGLAVCVKGLGQCLAHSRYTVFTSPWLPGPRCLGSEIFYEMLRKKLAGLFGCCTSLGGVGTVWRCLFSCGRTRVFPRRPSRWLPHPPHLWAKPSRDRVNPFNFLSFPQVPPTLKARKTIPVLAFGSLTGWWAFFELGKREAGWH